MSFELLDNILLESGIKVEDKEKEQPNIEEGVKVEADVEEGTKDVKPVEENTVEEDPIVESLIETVDDTMYSDLDQLIENSMRTSLRTTITESSIPPETKVDRLSIVERAIFTKEQMTKFVNENVHPVLECAGVFSGTYNLGGDNPIAISLPIYEASLILHIANEGLLESLSEDDKPTIKNSLYESMIENQKQEEVDDEKSMVIVNEHLAVLYDKYEIEEDSDREALFNEAVHIINKYGINNVRPSFYELAECVCEYNKTAEKDGEPLFNEKLIKGEELSESDNIFIKASERMSKINGLLPQSVKDRFKNVSESTVITGDSSVISMANTATGISAMVQWREGKSQCEKMECLEKALSDTVNSIKAQANTCKNTGNVKMCEACNKKLEDKWTIATEGIAKSAAKGAGVGAAVGAGVGAVSGKIYGAIAVRMTKKYKALKAQLKDLEAKKAKAKDKKSIEKQISKVKDDIKDMKKEAQRVGLKLGATVGAIGGGIQGAGSGAATGAALKKALDK